MKVLWIVKDAPADIGSAGRIRDYRLISYMKKHANADITCIATSADYGTKSMEALGIEINYNQFPKSLIEEAYKKYQKFDVVIISRWYLAEHVYSTILNCQQDLNNVVVDTVDIEWMRNDRQIEYSKKNNSYVDFSLLHDRKRREVSLYKNFKNFIFVSSQDENEFLKVVGKKKYSEIIAIPFHDEGYIAPPDTKNVYFIGNFLHHPNIHAAIRSSEIFHSVNRAIPDSKLYIIGKHPPTDVSKLHNDKYILVTGPQYKLNDFLRNMTVNLSPIYYGAGINGKIVEAMSKGIPTVTTSMGIVGIPEAKDAVHCFTGKEDNELADSIIDFMKDKDLRNEISSNAYQLIMKHFEFHLLGKRLIAFLEKIVNMI